MNIFLGLITSIQAPFFPIEASSKGASASQYGPVFGIIHAAFFLTNPLVARFIRKFGIKLTFGLSILLTSAGALSFGFLTYITPRSTFLALAYILRLLEGVSGAGLWNVILLLLLSRYPDRAAVAFALNEVTFGLGAMTGPVVGSFLYTSGGFLLPFASCAAGMAVTGALAICTLAPWMEAYENMDRNSEPNFNILKFLSTNGVIAGIVIV